RIVKSNSGSVVPFSFLELPLNFSLALKPAYSRHLVQHPFSGAVSSVPTYEEENGSDFLDNKDLETCNQCTHSHQVDKLQFIEEITPNPEVVKTHEHNNSPFPFHNNNSNQFQQFDILKNCSDHHFFGDGSALTLSHVKRGWAKKVQQEWNILEKKLPETIYVRVFEERIDLMRAVIVGASGIPYHDGIFFFDICFPPEYPNEPPQFECNRNGNLEVEQEASTLFDMCFGVIKQGSSNEIKCNKNHHWLYRKTIDDAVEALVGAFIVDSGFKIAIIFLTWLGIQRLEFPRDVVLDFFITSYLYSAYPKLKPGQLTDLRSFSVNNKPFACVAVDHIALVVFSSLGRLYEYANKRNPLE
ncbi:hypothetical protein S245_049145, partial [Arachis hypogaea]